MKEIIWSDNLSVGNEIIDSQHKKVFDLIKLINEEIQNKELNNLHKHIIELLDILHKHFEYEEKLMEENNYSELEDHIESHIKLKEIIEVNLIKIESNNILVLSNFLNWLEQSWYNHIINEDIKYKGKF